MAFELRHGFKIPDGMLVCHKCDNTKCVNPAHLFLGTNKDNAQDSIKKGRAHREFGEQRYNAVLTDDKVKEIRARYTPRHPLNSGLRLAEEFGVGKTMISAIVNNRRWKHLHPQAAREAGLLCQAGEWNKVDRSPK
jgi:hypothetical protein